MVRATVLKQEGGYDFRPAQAEFRYVFQMYTNGNEHIKDIAGQAHANLALMAVLEEDLNTAIVHYDRATQLVHDYRKAEYYSRLGKTYARAGRINLALDAYNKCTELAKKFHNTNYEMICAEQKREIQQ